MIIGDPTIFAVESGITRAYERMGLRALGFFVLHVSGYRYGVHKPDATLLACSFNEVGRRIARRGSHTAPFAIEPDAQKVAYAVRLTIYAPAHESEQLFGSEQFFGLAEAEFHEVVCSNELEWAPDGDEAFDDRSHVLHFDINDRVRLIAFRSEDKGYSVDRNTLREAWLSADDFYSVLQQWHDAFEAEWAATPKPSDATAE